MIARSERAYRWLLRAYPRAFREAYGPEMMQVFGDLYRDARRRGGLQLVGLWGRVTWDALLTALYERTHEMSRKLTASTLAAGALLLPTAIFLAIMFSRFVLGLQGPYDAWDRFYLNPNLSAVNWALERVIVLAPFAALALAALPVTRFQMGREDGSLEATITIKVNPATIGVIAAALVIIAVIMGYGFVENFRPV